MVGGGWILNVQKETRRLPGAPLKRSRALPSRRGISAPPTDGGPVGWGCAQPRLRLPQPPPFIAGLIFHLLSELIFSFLPLALWFWVSADVRTLKSAASGAGRSVRRVHGAVTSLLLLLLLQEELLQSRRARLHHGARPDGLRGGERVSAMLTMLISIHMIQLLLFYI